MKTRTKCKDCSSFVSYSDEWDAKYCKKCNVWLEKCCSSDPKNPDDCWFKCWERPQKPMKNKAKRDKKNTIANVKDNMTSLSHLQIFQELNMQPAVKRLMRNLSEK